jgi:hypothetical protein
VKTTIDIARGACFYVEESIMGFSRRGIDGGSYIGCIHSLLFIPSQLDPSLSYWGYFSQAMSMIKGLKNKHYRAMFKILQDFHPRDYNDPVIEDVWDVTYQRRLFFFC